MQSHPKGIIIANQREGEWKIKETSSERSKKRKVNDRDASERQKLEQLRNEM